MSTQKLELVRTGLSGAKTGKPVSFGPATTRRREQVTAVCYRKNGDGIELLLVRTRNGNRWTFPKGGAEPGLSYAESAAIEAVEEAGVHGRIEETPFARYSFVRRKNVPDSHVEPSIRAHLCEVLWRDSPQEPNRNPTWFTPEQGKERLREKRSAKEAAELMRLVDRALARIQRLSNRLPAGDDALQKVPFEAAEIRNYRRAPFADYVPRRQENLGRRRALYFHVKANSGKVLRLGPGTPSRSSS